MIYVKKALNIITNIATWGIVLCSMALIGALFIPRFFGIRPFIVLSSSMEPAVHTGSLAYIREAEGPFDEGDIIAFHMDGMPVVHRVAERTDEGYVTKGDANAAPDMSIIKPGQVLGECVLAVPGAGYMISSARQHAIHFGPAEIPITVLLALGALVVLHALQLIIESLTGEDEE